MSRPSIGSLFSGYGGLDLALHQLWPDARTAWVSDIESGPRKVLAHRYPEAPNLGDVTKVDWSQVEPVDIITGGSPCQDLSHAGKRAGMKAGTRSGLWASMCDAIDILRPSLVVWENVRGALSATATIGEVESCGFCVADNDGQPMRALGRVLGDLADIGYDAAWVGLRAADVGACHGRFRVFVLAWPSDADGASRDQWRLTASRQAEGGRALADDRGRSGALVALLPTVKATNNENRQTRSDSFHAGPNLGEAIRDLLPTPAVNDMGEGKTVEHWGEWTDAMKSRHGNGNGHGKSLSIETQRLAMLPTPQTSDANGAGDKPGEWADRWQLRDIALDKVQKMTGLMPTPSVADVEGGRKSRSGDRSDELLLNGIAHLGQFGQYAPAIARWEATLGRPAPTPTEPTGRGGANRLSPRFTEWMMGLPDGWITDVPGVTRNDALRLCGNGVVPQQAAEAIRWLLEVRALTSERAS